MGEVSGDCWPLQRKHAGSTKPYQGLSNHILSLLRLSSIMLGPRGKSRDNPGHFQPLHLQSFPRLKGVIIVKLIMFSYEIFTSLPNPILSCISKAICLISLPLLPLSSGFLSSFPLRFQCLSGIWPWNLPGNLCTLPQLPRFLLSNPFSFHPL